MSNLQSRAEDTRIRRPSKHRELLNLFKEEKIFSSFKNTLVFAASLGFKLQLRESFTDTDEPIMLRVFNDNVDIPFIYCLALAESGEIESLKHENFADAVRTFEEYACGGLSFLESEVDQLNCKESIERIIAQQSMDDAAELDLSELW